MWIFKGPSSFCLGCFSPSKNVDCITKDASILHVKSGDKLTKDVSVLHLKLGGKFTKDASILHLKLGDKSGKNGRFTYLVTSIPSSRTPHHHSWPPMSGWLLRQILASSFCVSFMSCKLIFFIFLFPLYIKKICNVSIKFFLQC
jgi:hypothetical protein